MTHLDLNQTTNTSATQWVLDILQDNSDPALKYLITNGLMNWDSLFDDAMQMFDDNAALCVHHPDLIGLARHIQSNLINYGLTTASQILRTWSHQHNQDASIPTFSDTDYHNFNCFQKDAYDFLDSCELSDTEKYSDFAKDPSYSWSNFTDDFWVFESFTQLNNAQKMQLIIQTL
jgi:hypothetical protein